MERESVTKIKPYANILVLNASYEVVNITSWKRAVLLIVKRKATVVSEKVIKLIEYVKIPASKFVTTKPSRGLIYKRDRNTCQYCGSTKRLTIDHVVPKSLGGDNTWQNLVVACSSCNILKADKRLEHTGMKLAKKPTAPMNKFMFIIMNSADPEWQQYSYE